MHDYIARCRCCLFIIILNHSQIFSVIVNAEWLHRNLWAQEHVQIGKACIENGKSLERLCTKEKHAILQLCLWTEKALLFRKPYYEQRCTCLNLFLTTPLIKKHASYLPYHLTDTLRWLPANRGNPHVASRKRAPAWGHQILNLSLFVMTAGTKRSKSHSRVRDSRMISSKSSQSGITCL